MFDTFNIEHHRFIAVFTQFLPVLSAKFLLPLKIVAISYSLNFALYHFVCYLLCGFFRQYKFAILALLVNSLF